MRVSDVREAEEHGCGLQAGDWRARAAGRLGLRSAAPKTKSQRTPSRCPSTQEMKKNRPKLDGQRCSSSEGLCPKHLCSRSVAIAESQHGGGWKGPLWVTQPKPLPKQGHPEQAAQDLVQAGLEYLERRRQPSLRDHPRRPSKLPYI